MIERPMHRFVLCALAVGVFSAPCVAQVQPGSTGGSIGKIDKSVSGGEEANQPRVAPHPKRETGAQQTSSGQSCNGLVGTWSWYRGVTEMTFLKAGTMRNSSGAAGTWICTGGRSARSGDFISKEQYTVSQDGKSMFVTSTWGGGVTFTATKVGSETAK